MFGSVTITTDTSTVRVTKHCHRLLGEIVRSPSLEILKTQMAVALSIPQQPTLLWAWTGLDGLQRHLQPQLCSDSWRLKLGTSCLEHALWAVFPWRTPPMGYCSQRLPQGPLRRGDGARLQVQATLGHRVCHAKGGTLKHHGDIWKVSGFLRKIFGCIFLLYSFVCSEPMSYQCWHFFPSPENQQQNQALYFFLPASSSSLPAARNQSGAEWQIHLPLCWHPFLQHH